MTTIESERLTLKPMTVDFLEASLAADQVTASRLIGLAVPLDWFESRWLIELRLGQLRASPGLLPWLLRGIGLRETGQMIGHIGFHSQPDPAYLREWAPGGVELGYTIYPDFQRRGYAREACAALMCWAHWEQKVSRFVVSIRPDNEPSLRIARHFGFRKIATQFDEEDGPEDIFVLETTPLLVPVK